jgi:hypothetical protein
MRRIGHSVFMGADEDGGKKFAIAHVSYDPETTLALVEVVIEPDGGGGVASSFFQDRDPDGDREANVALLRQAAEMVLEHAENMLNRPPRRPPE